MPILKNKTQGNYVNVYKGITLDHTLSLKDRGMLLTLLSLPDNWDFTIAGLGKILPDGKAAINNSLHSLQKNGYLTKKQTRGAGGVFSENIIEVHETPVPPFTEKRLPDKRAPDNRLPEKPSADNPVPENQPQIINKEVITQQDINQEGNNHLSISRNDVMDEIRIYTEIIKENIEYENLLEEFPYRKDIIDEILNLLAETVAIRKKTIRINGTGYPYELVKGKLLKLDIGHIRYVIDCMDKSPSKIKNIKNYLLTALYNAPNTINSYYRAEVNHDMYGGDD